MQRMRYSRLGSGLFAGLAVVAAGCEMPTDGTVGAIERAETVTLFKPYQSYPIGSWPEAVATGDLNGDGRVDVAITTSTYFDPANDNKLHVFLQGADGSLLSRVKYPIGNRAQSMDIGDVNGDGRADVVVGNFDSATIGVLLQNAAGTLDPMVTYATVNSLSVKIGDFNSDGRMDVVGINWGSRGDAVDVLLQRSDGTLAPPVTYHVNHGGYDEVDVGDVNGDGRTDIVVMSGQSFAPNLGILMQQADGTFAAPVYSSVGSQILTHGVAVGDINGDGLQDVVVSYGGNKPSSFIARFVQGGDGTLAPAASSASLDIPQPVILADVTGDGKKDVIVAHGGWVKMGVYRQTATGGLAAEELYPIPYASQYEPQGLAAGDINGDGLPDLVVADYNNGLVVLAHVDDVPPVVAVTGPSGAQYAGLPLSIDWTASDNAALASFDVLLSSDGGASFTPLAGCAGLPASARTCAWSAPGPAGSIVVRVRARDAANNQATADGAVTLVAPSLSVTAPAAGSSWLLGTSGSITWTDNLPATDTVRIELTRDGASYETLAAAAPNSGSYAWVAAGAPSAAARVRITWSGNGTTAGSSAPFTLAAPSLTVTAPAAATNWLLGTTGVITWTHNLPASDSVRVELSRDGGGTFETLAAAAPNTGSFAWTAAGAPSGAALVRVSWNATVGSSAVFTLVTPVLTVTAPAAGSTWLLGTSAAISWSHNLPAADTVRVELSRDGGGTFEILAASAPNSGSFTWTAGGAATASALVRVTWNDTAGTSAPFVLAAPALTVTAPAAGAGWIIGTPRLITWSGNVPSSDSVRIEVSRDGGGSYTLLADAAPNNGAFPWTPTAAATGTARLRITWTSGPGAVATSDQFSLIAATVTVTSPNTNVGWNVGTVHPITWTHNLGTGALFAIDVSHDSGLTWAAVTASAPAGAATTGSYNWTVTGPKTHKTRIRVTSVAVPGASDISNVDFTVK
jgi:hypothetical protein